MKKLFVIGSLVALVVLFTSAYAGAQAPLDPVKYGVAKNTDPSWKVRKVDAEGSFIVAYGSSSAGSPLVESRFNTKSRAVEVAVINGGERDTGAIVEAKKRAMELSYKVGHELPSSCGATYCYAKSHVGFSSSPEPVPTQIASVKKTSKSVPTPNVEATHPDSGNRIIYSDLPPCKCKPGNMSWDGTCNCNFQDGMENEKVIYMLRWVSPARFSKGLGEPYSRLNHVTFNQENISAEALAERDAYGQH